jgi:hypothetical protein
MADLKCRKCGNKNVSSESFKRRRLWAIILGASLIVFSVTVFVMGFTTELHRLSTTAVIVTIIPGIAILGFGLRQESVYIYKCESCGNTWERSSTIGPEEGDLKHEEYQTELQLSGLSHNEASRRVEAAKWFYQNPSLKAVEPLITCLEGRKQEWEYARIWSISALKKIGDERAIKPLINTAKDTDWAYENVRVKALQALSSFSNDEIKQVLEEASNDENDIVRKAAVQSLKELNKTA